MNGDWSFSASAAVSSLWDGATATLDTVQALADRTRSPSPKPRDNKRASKLDDRRASNSSARSSTCGLNPMQSPRLSRKGWLLKRGPMDNYKWKRYWCVLDKSLNYFQDEECKDKKGEVLIRNNTRVSDFRANDAPGDAPKYKQDRPSGFFVDVDPSAPAMIRTIHYFDAETQKAMEDWIEALASHVKNAPAAKPKVVGGFLELPGSAISVKSSVRDRGITAERKTAPPKSTGCEAIDSNDQAVAALEAEAEIKSLRIALDRAEKDARDAEEAMASVSFAEEFIIQDAEAVSERATVAESEALKEAAETKKANAVARKEIHDQSHEIDCLLSARARMRVEMTEVVGEAMDRAAASANSTPQAAQMLLQECKAENSCLRIELQAISSEKASADTTHVALQRLLESETAQCREEAMRVRAQTAAVAEHAAASHETDARLTAELQWKVQELESSYTTLHAERLEALEETSQVRSREMTVEEYLEEKSQECEKLSTSYHGMRLQVAVLMRNTMKFKSEAMEARSNEVWDIDRDDNLQNMEKEIEEQRSTLLSELSDAQNATRSAEDAEKHAESIAEHAEAKAESALKATAKKGAQMAKASSARPASKATSPTHQTAAQKKAAKPK